MRVTIALMAAGVSALSCDMARDQSGAGSDVFIGSELSCPSCSIAFDSVVTLEGATLSGPSTTIARDPTGLLYLQDGTDGLVKVYRNDGRFLRQVGRQGGGPGDYETIVSLLAGDDGSVHVLDAALGRHSKFSRLGEFLGSNPAPAVVFSLGAAVLLPGDRIAVNVRPRLDAASGYALQVIDQHGDATDFGDASSVDPRRRWLQHRLLWLRANGELLVARPFTFSIEVYSSDLTKKRSIRRVADWIPSQDPEEEPSDGLFDKPPTPMLSMIWEDAEGLLWLHMVAPSGLWRPGPPMVARNNDELSRETARTLASRPRFETIIEVVDLDRQRVLARYRRDAPLGKPFGGGYYASSVEDSASAPSIRISRARLIR